MNIPEIDKKYLWHPFTQMQNWCDKTNKPIVIKKAKGIFLFDNYGKKYIDGNSSIWTNVHGHSHPKIIKAAYKQIKKLDHSSFLGFTHKGAAKLAKKLIKLTNNINPKSKNKLTKVFFSDNGSTAIEVAMKMSIQSHLQKKQKKNKTTTPIKSEFIAFQHSYHGDTLGASSLGDSSLFFDKFSKNKFKTHRISQFTDLEKLTKTQIQKCAGLCIEPIIQGVAGMKPWKKGLLKKLRKWCNKNDIYLIFDEVMTGFGRTGKIFACEWENVTPDFLCLAKALSGGVLPLAATIVNQEIFNNFLGKIEEGKTFYYGHSYTANPIACATALASLKIFEKTNILQKIPTKNQLLNKLLNKLKNKHNIVENIRCLGLISAIDIKCKNNFISKFNTGNKICKLAAHHGLLTRPILNTIIFMPPLSITKKQLTQSIKTIEKAIEKI